MQVAHNSNTQLCFFHSMEQMKFGELTQYQMDVLRHEHFILVVEC